MTVKELREKLKYIEDNDIVCTYDEFEREYVECKFCTTSFPDNYVNKSKQLTGGNIIVIE